MKKIMLFLVMVSIMLVACAGGSGGSKPVQERIIGKWSGTQTSAKGDKVPATWEFLEGGTMVVKIEMVNVSYGATWSVEGNRVNIVTELDPKNPTYRDVEFVSDDVMKLTKAEANITETWTRVKE